MSVTQTTQYNCLPVGKGQGSSLHPSVEPVPEVVVVDAALKLLLFNSPSYHADGLISTVAAASVKWAARVGGVTAGNRT